MERIIERLSRLQRILLEATGLEMFLGDLTKLAADVVVPPATTSITLIRDGEPTTVVASDELAERLDEIQYTAGDGPCLHSIRTTALVECPNIHVEQRWPDWRELAIEASVRSALATPLFIDGETAGALNLYGYRAWTFTPTEVRRVEIFAGQAGGALTLLQRQLQREKNLTALEGALASRSVVDRAAGILMAQRRCDHDAAMKILRSDAGATNRPIATVAIEVVAGVERAADMPTEGSERRTRAD